MRSRSRFLRHGCWGIVAAAALQLPLAHAGLLGPEAVLATQAAPDAQAQAELERAKVRQFVESATLQERLRLMGVDGLQASRRVDAMTHEEVHALAQQIDSLPAGGALSDRDLVIILLVALLVVIL